MPPKAATKTQRKGAASGSSVQDACCICYQKIGPKDDVLFCSGTCQKHLHRYCVSVSEHSYKVLTSDDAPPFLCFCCYRMKKDEEIAKLQSIVGLLQDEISSLKRSKQDEVHWPSLRPAQVSQTAVLPPNLVSQLLALYLTPLKHHSMCLMPPTIMIVNTS